MRRKCGDETTVLSLITLEKSNPCAAKWRDVLRKGNKLLVAGKRRQLCCDALHFGVEFTHPIIEKRAAFPVIPLMTDIATMTAIGNDMDYTRLFMNQLRLMGKPGDMALAVSTSGKSPNLIYALEQARKQDMLAIAWAGKDGGRFPELADYCLIVPSYSIHRIQEVHATLVHIAWDLIHLAAGSGRCHLNFQ